MSIARPYLMFLGDAADQLAAKTAQGVKDWRPDWCVDQLRLPDMTIREAVAAGARTLVVGVANRGGVIGESWIAVLKRTLELGLDLASGLHKRLSTRRAERRSRGDLDTYLVSRHRAGEPRQGGR